MKIIHYIPALDKASGGTTTYIKLLADEIGKYSELHVVSHGSDIIDLPYAKIHIIDNKLTKLESIKKDWLNILNEVKPDIVHINCCWLPLCSYFEKWAKAEGYPIFLTPHGMLEPWVMKRNYWTKKLPALLLYQKKAVKDVSMIHATAEAERENILKLGWNNNVTVIPNGIRTDNVERKTDWNIKKKILFLSRIHVKKGIEELIEAVHLLSNELKGYEICVAGEGEAEYINYLKEKIRNYNIENYFRFVGGVYGDHKWELFKESDFFVLPTYCENFGYVIAESLICGTPVITTKNSPWKDLIDYNCGDWINLNIEELKGSILKMISYDADKLKTMGINGASLIKNKYDATVVAKELYDTYKRFLDARA